MIAFSVFFIAIATIVVDGKDKWCKPICLDANCEPFDDVQFTSNKWPIWNSSKSAQVWVASSTILGGYLHGPRFVEGDFLDLIVSATWRGEVYHLSNLTYDSTSNSYNANKTTLASASAVSTTYPMGDGFLAAQGNPCAINGPPKLSKSHELLIPLWDWGQLNFVSSSGCNQIWPAESKFSSSKSLNTLECSEKLGLCFFTVWKFWGTVYNPDCLHYCKPDSFINPTSCLLSGILHWKNGEPLCHAKGKGGAHGFSIGEIRDKGDFDLYVVLTQGINVKSGGASSLHKLTLKQDDLGNFEVLYEDLFGTDFWQAQSDDVGMDHVIYDSAGYVWTSSFRQAGNGATLFSKDGDMLMHISFNYSYVEDNYIYPSGLAMHGHTDQKGSLIAVSTSNLHALYEPERAKSMLVLIDISDILQ